jgi:hypothetical protein
MNVCPGKKKGNNVHTNRTSHYGNNQKRKIAITSTKIDISLPFNERNGIEQNHLTQYRK